MQIVKRIKPNPPSDSENSFGDSDDSDESNRLNKSNHCDAENCIICSTRKMIRHAYYNPLCACLKPNLRDRISRLFEEKDRSETEDNLLDEARLVLRTVTRCQEVDKSVQKKFQNNERKKLRAQKEKKRLEAARKREADQERQHAIERAAKRISQAACKNVVDNVKREEEKKRAEKKALFVALCKANASCFYKIEAARSVRIKNEATLPPPPSPPCRACRR